MHIHTMPEITLLIGLTLEAAWEIAIVIDPVAIKKVVMSLRSPRSPASGRYRGSSSSELLSCAYCRILCHCSPFFELKSFNREPSNSNICSRAVLYNHSMHLWSCR